MRFTQRLIKQIDLVILKGYMPNSLTIAKQSIATDIKIDEMLDASFDKVVFILAADIVEVRLDQLKALVLFLDFARSAAAVQRCGDLILRQSGSKTFADLQEVVDWAIVEALVERQLETRFDSPQILWCHVGR